MRRRSVLARAGWVAGPLVLWLAGAQSAAAHGIAPAEPPTLATLLFGWTWEPLPTLAIGVSLAWWWWAVRRVNAAHPANPVPRRRSVAFGLAMLALAFALISGIERYDTTLFSVHMVQHILLMLVAAPLIALAAPITLILRLSSPATRKGLVLPVLHSRVMRVLAFPVVAWLIFAVVMWVSHFSPLFNAALEDPLVHTIEHAIFLVSALLFWWPAVGLDPTPWRMGHPGRLMHIFMQMMQNTFLAVVILFASGVLYPHYETLVRSWGPDPAGRPATGRRPHVVHRRPDLPLGAHGRSSRAGSGPTPGTAPGPTATPRSRWPRSASASRSWPSGWRGSAARRRGRVSDPAIGAASTGLSAGRFARPRPRNLSLAAAARLRVVRRAEPL